MSSTSPDLGRSGAVSTVPAPAQSSSRPRAAMALFRADLRNFLGRWSTWPPLGLGLALVAIFPFLIVAPNGTTNPQKQFEIVVGLVPATSLVVFAALGYLCGAAWMGAEHSAGSIGTWLTFNPRRGRVWLSRLAVAVLVPTALALVAMLAATAVLLAGDPSSVADLSSSFGPYLLVVAGFSALGFSIASLGRHVLWALGAFAGYAVLTVLGWILATSLPWGSDSEGMYLIDDAVADLLSGPGPMGYSQDVISGVPDFILGGAVWVGFVTLVVALALVVFVRRDVD